MARLPTAQDLGERSFDDRSKVVRIPVNTSGQDALINSATNFVARREDRLNRNSLSKAKIHFQKMKLEADNAFDEDPDFETYSDRYDEMMGKAVKESSDMVRNSGDRKGFEEELSLYRAQGTENMRDFAFGKESQQGIADLNETLTVGRQNYLNAKTPADRMFAREAMMESIDSAEDATYMDASQAQVQRQTLGLDLAVASVEIETPDKQLELLKSNKQIKEIIPVDVRKDMIRAAEGQLDADKALTTANQIRVEGGDRTERLDKINKIKDPQVKAAARSQVLSDLHQEKLASDEARYEIYDGAKKTLQDGSTWVQYKEANPKEWDLMSAAQRQDLMAQTAGKARKTSRETYAAMVELSAENPNKAKEFLREYPELFSDADAKSWENKLAKAGELDSFLTRSETLTIKMGEAGINKNSDAHFKALNELDVDYMQFQKNHKRVPNAKELEAMTDGVFDKVVDTVWFNPFSRDKYGFDVGQAGRKELRMDQDSAALKEKTAKFDSIVADYRRQIDAESDVPRPEFTDEEIALIYRDAVRRGLIDE